MAWDALRRTYFDGVDDYISLGSLFHFQPTDTFSISLKFNTTDTGVLFGKWNLLVSPGYVIEARGGGHNKITFAFYSPYGDAGRRVQGSTVVTDGVDHHLVITNSGSGVASGMKIYIDGVLETLTVILDTSPGTLSDSDVWIGDRNSTSRNPLEGCIGDVKVFNDVLSPAEAQYLHDGSGSDPGGVNLIGSYDGEGADDWGGATVYGATTKVIGYALDATGSLELTGFPATFSFPCGSIELTGFNANFGEAEIALDVTGSIELAGYSAAWDRDISLPAGSLELTGFNATLEGNIKAYATGSLELTGFNAEFGRVIDLDAIGSLAVAGFGAAWDRDISLPSGAIELTGFPLTFYDPVIISLAETGEIRLTGYPLIFVSRNRGRSFLTRNNASPFAVG